MYAFIEGQVAEKQANELVLSVQGVGYQIMCTQAALAMVPPKGEYVRVYTWLSVREDAFELFGFASKEERSMFLSLNTVSGIGPRTALNVLNSMPLKDLTLAILTEDIQTLSRAPGVGKKTAQRIALELKDRLSKDSAAFSVNIPGFESAPAAGDAISEAILALQGLGYSQNEAAMAISKAHQQGAGDKADDLVRLALRGMMKG
ncbi:MAG: Holliday junction branch migration protein RuvA [Christensenellales bacterium]|jgi:Holliday junction DNA helicase RuvA